jgi:hypothetical protein
MSVRSDADYYSYSFRFIGWTRFGGDVNFCQQTATDVACRPGAVPGAYRSLRGVEVNIVCAGVKARLFAAAPVLSVFLRISKLANWTFETWG